MTGRGSGKTVTRLLCAAASIALSSGTALAQAAPPAAPPPPSEPGELDPNAPLAPMPDLGVDWPDLNAKDTALPPEPTPPEPVGGYRCRAHHDVAVTWRGTGCHECCATTSRKARRATRPGAGVAA